MTRYSLILFIHVLGALGLFIGYGLEWTASSLLRSSTNSDQARAWLRVYGVSPTLSGPALAVIVLSGGYLASLAGVIKQGWIPAALIGIVVALFLGIVFNVPRMRAIRESLPAGNEPLSDGVRARLNDPLLATAVRLRTMIATGIVFLMATERSFGFSMIALAGAALLGLLISVPWWIRKPGAHS